MERKYFSVAKVGSSFCRVMPLLAAWIGLSSASGCEAAKAGEDPSTTQPLPKVAATPRIRPRTRDRQARVASTPPGMVLVPEGSFFMGCHPATDADCQPNEKPGRKVELSAYFIDRTEVSVAAYRSCVDAGLCTAPQAKTAGCNWGRSGRDQHPINCITRQMARDYCRAVGKDLPSEAQWEKAARGERPRTYVWGNEPPPSCELVHMGRAGRGGPGCGTNSTLEVGTKSTDRSPYGVMDMGGNVAEYTLDVRVGDAYERLPTRDPILSTGGSGMVQYSTRGGAYDVARAIRFRTASRLGSYASNRGEGYGMRCAAPTTHRPASKLVTERTRRAERPKTPAGGRETPAARASASGRRLDESAAARELASWISDLTPRRRTRGTRVPLAAGDALAAVVRTQLSKVVDRIRWVWVLGGRRDKEFVAAVKYDDERLGFLRMRTQGAGIEIWTRTDTLPWKGAKLAFEPKATDVDGDRIDDLFVRFETFDPEHQVATLAFLSRGRIKRLEHTPSDAHGEPIETKSSCPLVGHDGSYLLVDNYGTRSKSRCVMALPLGSGGPGHLWISKKRIPGACALEPPAGQREKLWVGLEPSGPTSWPAKASSSGVCPRPPN